MIARALIDLLGVRRSLIKTLVVGHSAARSAAEPAGAEVALLDTIDPSRVG